VTRLLAVQLVRRDSIPGKETRFLFFPKHLVRFEAHPVLIWYRRLSCKRQDDEDVKLNPDLHVLPRLLSSSVAVFLFICLYKMRGDNLYVTH
jgi:hypothetical protein